MTDKKRKSKRRNKYTLDELLSSQKPVENTDVIFTGKPVGKEVW